MTAQTSPYIPGHIPAHLVRPFDFIQAPGIERNPFATLETLRGDGEIFWNPVNPFFGGAWVVTQAPQLRHILSNPKLFSNRGEAEHSRSKDVDIELIPLEYDPPTHTRIRRFLNPIFAPQSVRKLADRIEARSIELVDALRPRGGCELIADFAVPFPVSVFLQMMGLPESDAPRVLGWKTAILHRHLVGIEASEAASRELIAYLEKLVAERRGGSGEDLISYVVNTAIDGDRLDDFEIRGILYLMLLAGLDTVTATLGWIFLHLAEHPEQQQMLRDHPDAIPQAIEELVRLYSITIAHRKCMQDIELGGVQMREGDWISIVSPLGSTDPGEYERPHSFDLARGTIRHFGFGFGPHICAGAHLARLELQIALKQWLARVPTWHVAPGTSVEAYAGTSYGLHALELTWS